MRYAISECAPLVSKQGDFQSSILSPLSPFSEFSTGIQKLKVLASEVDREIEENLNEVAMAEEILHNTLRQICDLKGNIEALEVRELSVKSNFVSSVDSAMSEQFYND